MSLWPLRLNRIIEVVLVYFSKNKKKTIRKHFWKRETRENKVTQEKNRLTEVDNGREMSNIVCKWVDTHRHGWMGERTLSNTTEAQWVKLKLVSIITVHLRWTTSSTNIHPLHIYTMLKNLTAFQFFWKSYFSLFNYWIFCFS